MNAPRASRASKHLNRGGIRKSRQSTPQRTDHDGDVDMTEGGRGGRGILDRTNRGHRGNRTHRGNEHRGPNRLYQPPDLAGKRARTTHHGSFSVDTLEKAIDNGDVAMSNFNNGTGGLAKITISGFQQNAKQMDDRWLNSFADWLRTKAGKIKFEKPRKNDKGIVTVFVRPEDTDRVMGLEGFSYKGGALHLKAHINDKVGQQLQDRRNNRETRPHPDSSNTKEHLSTFLKSKWNRAEKILDLSDLYGESALQNMGVFGSDSTKKKFFPALMKVCDSLWDLPKVKAEVVTGISLANNGASDVTVFSSLAPTFPQLKRLSLSNNRLITIESIKIWRWKFRDLEELDLSLNELSETPDVRETLKKWYPKLRQLNLDGQWEQVRSIADLTAASNPIPVLAASFDDEADIGANFVINFIPLFDVDRAAVINRYYDNSSTFSVSVDTKQSPIAFDTWLPKSRNLLKVTYPAARTARLFIGAHDIERFWATLPITKHFDPVSEGDYFTIECHSLPGVPDPSNATPGGVAGLIIMISSRFEEIDRESGQHIGIRTFHRTIVLGPGTSDTGIRVVSDILSLRPNPEENPDKDGEKMRKRLGPWNLDGLSWNHPEAPTDFGNAGIGKSTEQYQKERMTLEFSLVTKLGLVTAEECLAGNNWDQTLALADFHELQAKGAIPKECYYEPPEHQKQPQFP